MAAYKRTAKFEARLQKVKPFGQNVSVAVTLKIYRPLAAGDLDNRIKCVLDALNGTAYQDDRQVAEIHAYRFDDKERPRVEITIEQKLC